MVADVVGGNGVLVLTYEGLRVFRDFLLPYQWEYVVLDEGHKIRNPDTEVTLVCKQVCVSVVCIRVRACVCVGYSHKPHPYTLPGPPSSAHPTGSSSRALQCRTT